ncbi:uncharacterized protein L3040_007820 [Drepanopeziza brunnea f. sp. 'multigermtubi']|uniref:uncharacterized protein n=1 Tax=Drepanopeziza brunnea f. sp. 'multigermtubi' TaxID=698441 RepID=UPI002398C69F|nr:hypothetical protein L3040_007820 [Drepanopeziza brunnea f. sp. 'multigermtubi']
MTSLLLIHSLYSLIAARDDSANDNIALSVLASRDTKREALGTSLFVILIIINICIFVPVIFVVTYTLHEVFPTLAIVESADVAPEYEFVNADEAHDEDDDSDHLDSGNDIKRPSAVPDIPSDGQEPSSSQLPDETAGIPARPSSPVTCDIRATFRLLRAACGGSYRSGLARGFKWKLCIGFTQFMIIVVLISIPYIPTFVISIIASLATTQLATGWVHAVVSKQQNSLLWQNLPRYWLVLKATAIPIIAKAAITQLIRGFVHLFLGPRTGSADPIGLVPAYSGGFWLHILVLGLIFVIYIVAFLPIEVILTRTRASMLPNETNTLVPLDVSIQSHDPDGMGFWSWQYSWEKLSRASWIRIAKVYGKVFAITVAVHTFTFLFIGLQMLIVSLLGGSFVGGSFQMKESA